jgi:Ca2+-binding RTX toxin-like protein
MRKRKALGGTLTIGLWLICLVIPATGQAKIRCQRNADGSVLSVSATGATFAGVRRAGEGIKVFDLIERNRTCMTDATVTTTDLIKVFASKGASVTVELVGGPFAPGLTAEEDLSSEIELEASGPGYVEVVGGNGHDHFRYMNDGSESGLNLNPDEDEDLDFAVAPEWRKDMLFVADGGDGPDLIDALGSPALEMFAGGGNGNDTLVAPPTGAILEGERGSDRLIGGPAFDYAIPGKGADRVMSRGGSDLIEMKPDGSRDRIDCGPGHDEVARGDRFDRLRSC